MKFPIRKVYFKNEDDDTWDINTFNTDLQNQLRRFAARHPNLYRLESENKELGCVTYIMLKTRVSIYLKSPRSQARCKAASEHTKKHMIQHNDSTQRNIRDFMS